MIPASSGSRIAIERAVEHCDVGLLRVENSARTLYGGAPGCEPKNTNVPDGGDPKLRRQRSERGKLRAHGANRYSGRDSNIEIVTTSKDRDTGRTMIGRANT